MNSLALFRQLAVGLLPILVFVTAEAVWGTRVGLLVAIASGVLELGWTWLRQQKFDSLVVADTLLVVLLGGGSLWLESPLLFKIKPALMDLLLASIFGLSAFSRFDPLALMMRRTLRGIELSPLQTAAMRQKARILFALLLGHAALVLFASWKMSPGAWAFISGALLYIVIGLWLGAEFLLGIGRKRRYSGEEWFDLVTADGMTIGQAPRSVCHSGPGKMHPVIHLHLLDAGGRLYLQKRSARKEIQPGKWDTAVGGHVAAGETVEAALGREAREELNLAEFSARPLLRYVWQSPVETELVHVFLARGSFPGLRPDPAEIEEGRFWKIRNIRESMGRGVFTPNFEHEFERILPALTGNDR